jgi:PAS domain S-box-containing protein
MEGLLDRYIGAEQALRHSEEQFRLLVTSVREYAVFMLDPTRHIVSWNTGAELIKGYTPDDIIGRHARPSTRQRRPRRADRPVPCRSLPGMARIRRKAGAYTKMAPPFGLVWS